jgi:predicted RNA polymerase sigma factor
MSEPRPGGAFFRHEFGRLAAVLTRSLGVRRLDLVEDVVQAALVQALEAWSRCGVPEDTAGWLYRTARNSPQVGRKDLLGSGCVRLLPCRDRRYNGK